jgi:hypothetical protein
MMYIIHTGKLVRNLWESENITTHRDKAQPLHRPIEIKAHEHLHLHRK